MASDEPREWLIRKDGYYYRPNCQGYTTRKIEAGRYTKQKADAEAAVEPWHMSAIHQDEVPDEPAVADFAAQIAALEAELAEAKAERDAALSGIKNITVAHQAAHQAHTAAEARAEKMAEALEPFARADRALGSEAGPFRFETSTGHVLIRREDLHQASAALGGDHG